MIQQPQREALARPVRIQRQRTKGWHMPPNTVYVGRGSIYGNPYKIGEDGDLETCIRKYKNNMKGMLKVRVYTSLVGKNLACWCPLDQPCHADVLLELANPAPPKHTHVYERLSLCCGAVRQDRNLALYDADLEPVCDECGTLATFVSACGCGDREDGK